MYVVIGSVAVIGVGGFIYYNMTNKVADVVTNETFG